MTRSATNRRPVGVSIAIAVGVATSLIAGGPVQAKPPGPAAGTSQIFTFDATALQKSVTTAGLADVAASARIKEHLDAAARSGRLVDTASVRTSSVADPFNPSERIRLVWDGRKAPEKLVYSRKYHEGGDTTAIGLQLGGGDASAMPSNRLGPKGSSGGSGFGSGFDYTGNMYMEDNGCSTGWFVPSYVHNTDHKIVSCYEALGVNLTPIWVYNRWALWTPGAVWDPTGWVRTNDMEVSARPWSGYANRIYQLADWKPRSTDVINACDTNQNLSLGGSWNGITGNVTLPINTCNQLWLNITAGPGLENRMTIDFDGLRSGQLYMDIAGKYDAVNKYVLPFWADRNYMQVRYCGSSAPLCYYENPWSKQDSGW